MLLQIGCLLTKRRLQNVLLCVCCGMLYQYFNPYDQTFCLFTELFFLTEHHLQVKKRKSKGRTSKSPSSSGTAGKSKKVGFYLFVLCGYIDT